MKYYLHDTNAFQDEKITELFMTHGYEGLGLFYCILEKLAHQEKPIKTAVLKRQLYVGKKLEKCWAFMEEIGIISSNNGETFNNNLLKFSEKYQVFKEKNRERVAHWRESQADTKPVTHYVPVRNAPKVNISKVNKEVNTSLSDLALPAPDGLGFETFWQVYGRKEGSKSKMGKQWAALNAQTRQTILAGLPAYRTAKTVNGPHFLPMPQTFLNGKLWDCETFGQAAPLLRQTPNEIPSNWNVSVQGPYLAAKGMGMGHMNDYLKPEFQNRS